MNENALAFMKMKFLSTPRPDGEMMTEEEWKIMPDHIKHQFAEMIQEYADLSVSIALKIKNS